MKAYQPTIDAAIKKVVNSLKDVDDIYALGVAAYALQLAQFESKDEVLNNLLNKAQSNGNFTSNKINQRIQK